MVEIEACKIFCDFGGLLSAAGAVTVISVLLNTDFETTNLDKGVRM
ncbi:MAG: hypothetical protein R2771_15295 [Saprospiraceae bacterium]